MNENDKQVNCQYCVNKVSAAGFMCIPCANKLVNGEKQAEPVAWAEEIIDDLQGQFDTDGITHEDSGDALIYLSQAISSVQDAAKRHRTQPVQPAGAQGEPVGEVIDHERACLFGSQKLKYGTLLYTAPPAAAINEQLLEALKELMYARTDKAEGMAEAAIAAAEAEKAKGGGDATN